MLALLRRFIRNNHGGLAPAYAGFITMMLGGAALSVDYSTLVREDSRLQIAVDAATSAAAKQLPDTAAALSEARRLLAANLPSATYGDLATQASVQFGVWQNETFYAQAGANQAVRVAARWDGSISKPLPTTFGSTLGMTALEPHAEAVGIPSAGTVCMLALGPETALRGLELSGGSDTYANNCEVHIHSRDSSAAAVLSGGGTLTSLRTCIAGNISKTDGYTPAPEVNCPDPRPDPMAGYTPSVSTAGCDFTDKRISGTIEILTPGVYCGGIEISGGGDGRFQPGIYVIKGGKFLISSSAASGTNVAFYFVNAGAELNISGGSPVSFTAPTTGPLQGFIFYEGPGMVFKQRARMSGGSEAYYEGSIYFPTQKLELSGGSVATSPSPLTIYVAYAFLVSGGGTVYLQAQEGATNVPIPNGLRGRRFNLVM
jgi:Flp pilus assembly protein TadG